MDHAGFILTSYALTIGGIAGYTWWMLRRARRLGHDLPDEDRPWT
jgi:hypothetical protein